MIAKGQIRYVGWFIDGRSPLISGWRFEGGASSCEYDDEGRIERVGGYTLDELRAAAKAAGTYRGCG